MINKDSQLTHRECVLAASNYISKRFNVVLPEFYCWNSELCDVIGFKGNGSLSVVVECKVSRSDFFNDAKKPFRIKPEKGMGDYRYYCCPKDLIRPEELPIGWGLMYVYPNGKVRTIKRSFLEPDDPTNCQVMGRFPKDKDAEFHLLYYYARRANYAGVHKTILEYRGYDK